MESQNVLIHVRFAPNASVVEISERPAALSPQDWFNSCLSGSLPLMLPGGSSHRCRDFCT